MLTPITSEPKRRCFAVYDLEWIPHSYELRLAGLYDGKRYQDFTTIDNLLEAMLTRENRGMWFFAHFGGMADCSFLLKPLQRQGFEVEASFSGASAIIIKITRGKGKGKSVWYLLDSFWLMRDSLRNIGKSLGIEKGNEDEEESFYADAPYPVLRDYNEQDCKILWKAIERFEEELWGLGSELMKTIAGTAMRLWRRKYLESDIETDEGANEMMADAYVASRVEVYRRHLDSGFVYDINSSFPWSMTQPIPGSLLGYRKKLPKENEDLIYIAAATVTVPDMFLPPLPYRHDHKILFPTGTWSSWFTDIDLELLEESGGHIDKVQFVATYEKRSDMAKYAEDLYGQRKRETDTFRKLLLKYLLNSLYGKTAEEREKSSLWLNPPDFVCPHKGANFHPDASCLEELYPGALLVRGLVDVPHRHVPIAAVITARSRRLLYNYEQQCSTLAYCDTDSVATTDVFETSEELGKLKLDKEFFPPTDGSSPYGAEFLRQKTYRLTTKPGKKPSSGKELRAWEEDQKRGFSHVVKSKGFSRMTYKDYLEMREGHEVEQLRMARLKEMLRSGNLEPRDVRIPKRMREELTPKRMFSPDGTSRPWTVRELEEEKAA